MGFQINTNVSALSAYRNLSNTQNSLTSSLEKLSSGLRINKAADDAAGLSISEGLRAQIGGLTVASRNAQDGISVVQTAEGALGEVHSNLQRLRDLAVQAGNDSNNAESRQAITDEATALVSEIGRISESTNFNGIKLLGGTAGTLQFQVGANGDSASQIGVNLDTSNVSDIKTKLETGTIAGAMSFSFETADATAGAYTFTSTKGGVATEVAVTTAAAATSVSDFADKLNSDADFSSKFSAIVNRDVDGAATGVSILAKDGGDVTADAATETALGAGTAGTGTVGLKFGSAAEAQSSIRLIDDQIKTVSSARSNLGAVQNRFETAINSINVSKENLSASESRIRDTDMASEMANFTRANILQQAGTSMLAQANSLPQSVLSLLG
ncbi:MAG: flagellin [Microbacteriaceae bacterium]